MNSAIPTAGWFLLCLWEIQIVSYFILRLIKHKSVILIIAVLSSGIGFILSYYSIANYCFINTSIMCLSYFLIGYLLKKEVLNISLSVISCLIIAGLLLCLEFFVFLSSSPNIFYRENILGNNYWVVIFTAFSGVLAVIVLSKAIDHNKILIFYGKNSLIILVTHLYFKKIITIWYEDSFVIFSLLVLLMIPVCLLIKCYFPYLIGRKSIIKLSSSSKD